jgi:hypothetical protein
MRNIPHLCLTLLLLFSSIAQATKFVQVAENGNMTVYIDIDSIAKEGGYTTANEIRDYKIPMDFEKGKTYRSSLGLAEIDCKVNTSRVAFIDAFELNGLKGKRIAHGVQVPMVTQIKPNTMTADVRDFLCNHSVPTRI